MEQIKTATIKTIDATASALTNQVVTDMIGTTANIASKGKVDTDMVSKSVRDTATAYDTTRKTGGCHRRKYRNIALVCMCVIIILLIFAVSIRTYPFGPSSVEIRDLNKLYTY